VLYVSPQLINDIVSRKLTEISALILLHEAHASSNSDTSEYFERIHHTKHLTTLVQNSAEEMTTGGEAPIRSCVKAASPFITIFLYQIATANLRRSRDQKVDGPYEDFVVIKAALRVFDERWRASGEWPGQALAKC
jgi:hypothetical protein